MDFTLLKYVYIFKCKCIQVVHKLTSAKTNYWSHSNRWIAGGRNDIWITTALTQHSSNGSKHHFSAPQLDHHVLKRNRSSLVSWNSGKGQRSWVKHGVSGGLCGFCVVLCADESQSSGEYLTTGMCLLPSVNINTSTVGPVCTHLSRLNLVKKSVLNCVECACEVYFRSEMCVCVYNILLYIYYYSQIIYDLNKKAT